MRGREDRGAVERAVAHGIDIARLEEALRLTPTERLERLARLTAGGESAMARAAAYGIDISLLHLALSWTPTRRLRELEALTRTTRALWAIGAKAHGPCPDPEAADERQG